MRRKDKVAMSDAAWAVLGPAFVIFPALTVFHIDRTISLYVAAATTVYVVIAAYFLWRRQQRLKRNTPAGFKSVKLVKLPLRSDVPFLHQESKSLLRALLATVIALFAAFFVVSAIYLDRDIPNALQQLKTALSLEHEQKEQKFVLLVLTAPFIVANLISFVGLFSMRVLAARTFIVTFIMIWLLEFMDHRPVIEAWWYDYIISLANCVEGAIVLFLALALQRVADAEELAETEAENVGAALALLTEHQPS